MFFGFGLASASYTRKQKVQETGLNLKNIKKYVAKNFRKPKANTSIKPSKKVLKIIIPNHSGVT